MKVSFITTATHEYSDFKALVKLIFRVNDESKLVHILKLSLWQKFLALGESFFVGITMLYGDAQL